MSITNVPELFGSMVFNDTVMKERLPKDVYKSAEEDHARGHRARRRMLLAVVANGNEGLGDRARAQPITRTGSSR